MKFMGVGEVGDDVSVWDRNEQVGGVHGRGVDVGEMGI